MVSYRIPTGYAPWNGIVQFTIRTLSLFVSHHTTLALLFIRSIVETVSPKLVATTWSMFLMWSQIETVSLHGSKQSPVCRSLNCRLDELLVKELSRHGCEMAPNAESIMEFWFLKSQEQSRSPASTAYGISKPIVNPLYKEFLDRNLTAL